jgi:hypothetical protein
MERLPAAEAQRRHSIPKSVPPRPWSAPGLRWLPRGHPRRSRGQAQQPTRGVGQRGQRGRQRGQGRALAAEPAEQQPGGSAQAAAAEQGHPQAEPQAAVVAADVDAGRA